MGFLVIESTSSGPEYLQLSRAPLFVWSTNSSREHFQLSKVPIIVESTSICLEYFQLSNSRKYLRMPGAVIQSTSSCRGDLQWSEVSPFAGSSHPEYLELSRGPPIVGSISVCREQLSGVPRVVEGTLQ